MSPRLRIGLPLSSLSSVACVVWVVAVSAGAFFAPPLQAQEACEDCHDEALEPVSVHTGFGCSDCHSDIEDYPHPEAPVLGNELCAGCHDVGDTLAESVHADALSCLTCHGERHGVRAVDDAASPASPLLQVRTCGACHDTPPALIDGYVTSVHGRALLVSGLVNAPSCSDCHGSHGIYPTTDPRSTFSRRRVPDTCGQCHLFLLNVWMEESAHGLAWKAGEDGPVCIDCHSSHRVMDVRQEEMRHKFPEGCGSCHGEAYSTYRDSFHGKATDLGFLTAAICSDCHTPHQNLEVEDPRSSVNPSRLQETCGRCHGEVSAAFVSFQPHSDPTDSESDGAIYFVWLFMTALLVGVFGFFGLHDLLWLQRTLVAVLRGEIQRHNGASGPHVRRFSKRQIWLHVTIIVTFLLLAATGLPLKFHFTAWAKSLALLLGGVSMAGTLHRLAALATFGYFLVHLVDLTRRALVLKEPGLFWGWRSMVPSGKDLEDLWRHLRYFLYLGERPRFDRFTYWEKFDYFAVFWGVVIIGCSGLMLWFPGFFTSFLPGWALNAAFVVHSDEALLAVVFIFVFHFFHTHLRPESFPLDPVVFVGSVPLSRMEEERPLEHERLVASGEMSRLLVSAPTAEQLRRVRIFGFAAVTLGLLLALGILWAFVAY